MEYRGLKIKDNTICFKDLYSINDKGMLLPYGDYTSEQICNTAKLVYNSEWEAHTGKLDLKEVKEVIDFVLDNVIRYTHEVNAIIKYKDMV